MYGVLSSAWLAISKSQIPKNKSQMYMLINNGPNMEPCETPLKMPSKLLYEPFVLLGFLFSR